MTLSSSAQPAISIETAKPHAQDSKNSVLLFLASFLALYFELIIIRYLATEIRVFAYLKNLSLIACFLGIGLGMLAPPSERTKKWFPVITLCIFMLIAFAGPLRLTHISFPLGGYVTPGDLPTHGQSAGDELRILLELLEYLVIVPGILYLLVAFFSVFGGLVGRGLAQAPPLRGYGVNLAGSLAGIAAFSLISFLNLPPAYWLFAGLLMAVPFFIRDRAAIVSFVLVLIVVAIPQAHTFWSPYYRITLLDLPSPPGWDRPSAYFVDVNHDYHQKMLDLSSEFMSRFPDVEPNRSGFPTYELPYRIVGHPAQVLVVGAGTGNDVAAALRHGATHVDAVEIDPVILALGRKYHPEHPYDSPRVTVFVDDARAYFGKSREKYDLIVFGYLDSHTLLTSFSSVRLDNYVYTLESFREARTLLAANGTLVLAFSSGRSFLGDRMFATLSRAFGESPLAYFTGYDESGVVYVEGAGRDSAAIRDFPEISKEFESRESSTLLATDRWPFLYLQSRTIPLSILVVLALFLYMSVGFLRQRIAIRRLTGAFDLHLFFLGAGFLLMETKGVTELSLLFGSTWIVNGVVIAAFLTMGLLANTVIAARPVSRGVSYAVLFGLLVVNFFVPYSLLNSFPPAGRLLAAGFLVGLPVFFSGMIFSRSFRDVKTPSHALGVNLLGAVIGGALENLVMIGGTQILGVLAIALYALSLFFLRNYSNSRLTAEVASL